MDGGVLASDGLKDLLGYDSTVEGADRPKVA